MGVKWERNKRARFRVQRQKKGKFRCTYLYAPSSIVKMYKDTFSSPPRPQPDHGNVVGGAQGKHLRITHPLCLLHDGAPHDFVYR